MAGLASFLRCITPYYVVILSAPTHPLAKHAPVFSLKLNALKGREGLLSFNSFLLTSAGLNFPYPHPSGRGIRAMNTNISGVAVKQETEWIRAEKVKEILKVSDTTLWRLAQRPDFPKARKISERIRLWSKDEIHDWLEHREKAVKEA